jgi:cytochrome c peroxidase
MSFDTKRLLSSFSLIVGALVVSSGAFGAGEQALPAEIRILKEQAKRAGLKPASEIAVVPSPERAKLGKRIFETTHLSLNGQISCKTCHLGKFGSGDGIPLAAAIFGKGEGPERLLSGAKLLPRNSLALWGRGSKGFTSFFWDGRVEIDKHGKVLSVFGNRQPSDDALAVASHLPTVEIREMLDEDELVRKHKIENSGDAEAIFNAVTRNVLQKEKGLSAGLAKEFRIPESGIKFRHLAAALAAHIRSEFPYRDTEFHKFVFEGAPLSDAAIRGGITFFGKGKCVTCHTGPHFSDFRFHAIGVPQLGFGKSGFGVDYGRYGVTFDPQDLYKFRTPPLINVANTSPYGHDGALSSLESAVVAHFDPLRLIKITDLSAFDRFEFYKRLALASVNITRVGYLSDLEVTEVAAFLRTLSYPANKN